MRRHLLRARGDYRQFWAVRVEAANILGGGNGTGHGRLHLAVRILEQPGLAAGHGKVHVRQNLGIEQRAVQRAVRIIHVVALAQRIQAVLLPRVHGARQLQGIGDGADILDAQRLAPVRHQGQLIIKEAHVERRVMDDQLRALNKIQQALRDVGELRLARQLLVGNPVHLHRPGINLALRVEVLLIAIVARPPADQLDAADFNDPVALGRFEAGGFRIENYLAHLLPPFHRLLASGNLP